MTEVEKAQAELAKAQATLAAAQKEYFEAQEAKEQERRQAEMRVLAEPFKKILEDIAAAFNKHAVDGLRADVEERNTQYATHYTLHQLKITAGEEESHFTVDFHRKKGYGKSKYHITAGSYGKRTTYQERADGTFNVEGIAKKLLELLAAKKARDAARQKQALAYDGSLAAVNRLRSTIGYTLSLSPSTQSANLVAVGFHRMLTEAEVIKLHDALKVAGFIS